MPSRDEIYTRQGDRYERLVSREDHEGNILVTVREIRSPEGLDVVESLADRLISTDPVILPECTGVWSMESQRA